MAGSFEIEHMSKVLDSEASLFLKFHADPDLEIAPALSREQEGCIVNLHSRWLKRRVQMVCYRFDILFRIHGIVIQLNKHGPPV